MLPSAMKPLPFGLLVGGLVLFMGGPFAGIFLTVLGMIGAFKALGNDGIGDPKALAGHIGGALVATEIGVVAAVLGIVLMVAGAISHHVLRQREGDRTNKTR